MVAKKFPLIKAFPAHFNLTDLNGKNGFTINGVVAGDRAGCSVSGAGDVNADGIADFVIGACTSGWNYVVFGSKNAWSTTLNLANLKGNNGFAIYGENSGIAVSGTGDVNGDGIADLVIGASSVNNGAGQTYVVFGNGGVWPATLNFTSLNGKNGFTINGVSGDAMSVGRAGDINGDSIADVVTADVGANNGAGQTYVVFGNKSGFPATLNAAGLNGSDGFVINGIKNGDYSGDSISGAGDLNGDGIDDLAISAPVANNGTGQSYVVFGNKGGFPATLDLVNLNGANGFIINEHSHNLYNSESSISRAGDVNGDGVADLVIGAEKANNYVGQAYVVFGNKSGFPSKMDVSSLNGMNGFTINGVAQYDACGVSVSGIGDVNSDGVDDILIGALNANDGAGQGGIIFGIKGGFPAVVDLAKLNGMNGFVVDGINSNDNAGFSVSGAGDVNADGIADFLIGSFRINPIGQSYLVFGGNPAISTSSPTQSPSISVTPSPTMPPYSPPTSPTAPSMNSQPFLSTDALHLLEIIIPTIIGLSCITGIAAYGFYRYKHHDHADLGHSILVQPLLAEEGGDH